MNSFYTRFRGSSAEVIIDRYDGPNSLGWHFADQSIAALPLTKDEEQAIATACARQMGDDPQWLEHHDAGSAEGKSDYLAGRPKASPFTPGTPEHDGYNAGYDEGFA